MKRRIVVLITRSFSGNQVDGVLDQTVMSEVLMYTLLITVYGCLS